MRRHLLFVAPLAILIALQGAPLAYAEACTDISPCSGGRACVANVCQDVQTPGGSGALFNPLGSGATLPGLLASILAFVVRIGAIVVVFMLVYVGFLFVTARGKEADITQARQALLWTVVGALILLGAQAIAIAIQATVQALSV